jgi:pyruvyl transferase EpsO
VNGDGRGGNTKRGDLITRLQGQIRARLDPLIEPGRRFAMVEYPTHPNVGDHAIWLGETRYLAARSCPALFLSDRFGYSPDALRRRLRPGDLIILHGGGNLGDIHPGPEALRQSVLRTFTDVSILQLPQTIRFSDAEGLGATRAAIDGHPDFTLLVRDRMSQEIAADSFNCTTMLCPDMAFMLGPLERPAPPSCNGLWIARTDHESDPLMSRSELEDLPRADWAPPSHRTMHKAAYHTLRWTNRGLGRYLAGRGNPSSALAALSCRLFDPVANRHLRSGLRLLGSSRVVVTDRLHAHILCLLLGVPHVLLDDRYGKVRGYVEAWTSDSDLVHMAADPDEADSLVRSLLS